jgi:hypothetical protein
VELSSEGNRVSASMRDEAPNPVRSPGKISVFSHPSAGGYDGWLMRVFGGFT